MVKAKDKTRELDAAVDELAATYAELAARFRLSTQLPPPDAMRRKADELAEFLPAVGSDSLRRSFNSDIRLLRRLAASFEALGSPCGASS